MMAFITHYLKNQLFNWRVWLLAAAVLCMGCSLAQAEQGTSDAPVLALERTDDGLWLSTHLNFELSPVVEDALLKGIPIIFVAQADLMRERWYWTNRKITTAQRRMRLSYHPLTRRWRLSIVSGEVTEVPQGLALNQNFETMAEMLATVRRISRWRIADASDIEPGAKYVVEFRFALDVTQLPRPLQIGTLGQSDWLISLTAVRPVGPELSK